MKDSTPPTTHISRSLKTLLSETLFHADARGGFILNRGEPGLFDTCKSLSAQTALKAPAPGRKPICSHANHVLFGLELIDRAIHGDDKAFDKADWDVAWRLERVDERQWADLLQRFEKTATAVLESAPQHNGWNEIMLTGVYSCAAHEAYHLGAIRQILRDINAV